MPLLKKGKFVQDAWVQIGDEDALPADKPVIVSLARWRSDAEALKAHRGPLGIRLASSEPASEIAQELAAFELVVLSFPSFTDGRHYSSARLLRERYGFKGEVRATGDVLRDQYRNMIRCGFDAFEVPADTNLAMWAEAAEEFSHAYQRAADGVQAIWARRAQRRSDAA